MLFKNERMMYLVSMMVFYSGMLIYFLMMKDVLLREIPFVMGIFHTSGVVLGLLFLIQLYIDVQKVFFTKKVPEINDVLKVGDDVPEPTEKERQKRRNDIRVEELDIRAKRLSKAAAEVR